jgi:hypothetical protein
LSPDDSVPAVNKVPDDFVFLGVPFKVDDEIVIHEGEVFQMFSTKFEIVLKPGIDFIQSLVFPLQHRHFLPPLIHLINSHPQDILRLPNILRQIIIFHNLILRGPLIMNTLTLVLICECGYRGDIPLQSYDIIVRVVDLVI